MFTNALGESLSVKVMSTEEETAQLLGYIVFLLLAVYAYFL